MPNNNLKIDYDSFPREYAIHRQVHPEVIDGLQRTDDINQTSKVLDVGCGTENYWNRMPLSVYFPRPLRLS